MSEGRLDRVMVERGLVTSRTKAARQISSGTVLVDGVVTTKPSALVDSHATISLTTIDQDVGQGAKKLRGALADIPLNLSGAIAVDLGASTGGFTQVLLEAGAMTVVAIDVGHAQLAEPLRSDSRVINLEGVNVAQLGVPWWKEHSLPDPVHCVVADLSFVSLRSLITPMVETFGVHSHYLLLVKPQFEVGKGHTTRGVVKNVALREEAVHLVAKTLREHRVTPRHVAVSPITGEKGNVEYFVYASATPSVYPAEWDGQIPRP